MLAADFPWILRIKTALLKMFGFYKFKPLPGLNNSLVCWNLLLLKMVWRTTSFCCFFVVVVVFFFSIFFCQNFSNKDCHSLCNWEYTSHNNNISLKNDLDLNSISIFFEILFSIHFTQPTILPIFNVIVS